MINKHLQDSLEILEKDASFIKGIKEIIQNSEESGLTREEGMKSIKRAYALILHILDFYVTIDMIDMDADLLRLCDEDPQMAKRFRDSLNDAALTLKKNYQYLCKKGTIYEVGLPRFKDIYGFTLMACIRDQETGETIARPDYILPFSEMEFIKIGNDRDQLENKLKHVSQVEFSINSIQRFIDNCFSWSDKISEYLSRMRADKSPYAINRSTLNSIHAVCNGDVYYETTADSFAHAIVNKEEPSFYLKNKDRFYAVCYALYFKMGALSNKDQWLNTVLNSFDIRKSDYLSTVKRIKDKKTKKLNEFYDSIIRIIDGSGI